MLDLAVLLLLIGNGAQPAGAGEFRGDIPGGRMEILDAKLESGLIAFRVEEAPLDEDVIGRFDCKYAGMRAAPFAGVTLGLWDAKKDSLSGKWVVYNLAHTEEDCTPAAVSAKNLADAKTAFAAAGLDSSKKPVLVELAMSSKGSFSVKVGDAKLSILAKTTGGCSTVSDAAVGDYRACSKTLTLSKGGKVFYRRTAPFSDDLVGNLDLVVTHVLVQGKKAVFVELALRSRMDVGQWDELGFSPVLDLQD